MVKYKSKFPDGEAVDAALTVAANIEEHRDGSGTKFLKDDFSWAEPAAPSLTFGTTSGTACEGNDARLSNDRTPLAHSATHKSTGTDAIKLDELAAPDDITDLNVSTSAHGLCPKLSGVSGAYLDSEGNWTIPGTEGIVFPGSSSVFLTGLNTWAIPSASGSIFRPAIYIGKTGSGADYICDGDRDDVQFNQALAAAQTNSVIYILPGTYDIRARLTQSAKNLTIIGLGKVILNLVVAESDYGTIYFAGTTIASPSLSSSAAIYDRTITVSSAAGLQVGDLVKIRKNIKWSPTDYPNQQTGEMYEITGISGTTLTLNQPLLRAYATGDTVTMTVYRPAEIHIHNIEISGPSGTGSYAGLCYEYCKNSTMSKITVRDCGLYGLAMYSCYNSFIQNNWVYNSNLAGSGYGISVWNASAFIDISHNYVENCRHCVTMNASEWLALIRDVYVTHNTFIGGTAVGSNVIEAHPLTLSYYVFDNKVYPQKVTSVVEYPFAFFDGAQHSMYINNETVGGYGMVARRGVAPGGFRIIQGNTLKGANGPMYQGGDGGACDTLIVRNNTQDDGEHGVRLTGGEYYSNYIIEGNSFNSNSWDVVHITAIPAGARLSVKNNKIKDCTRRGIYIVGTSGSAFDATISDNEIINPSAAGSTYSGIECTYMTHSVLQNNKIIDHNARGSSAILLGTGCDYNVVTGNVARGMTGTKFSLTGANNQTDNYEL